MDFPSRLAQEELRFQWEITLPILCRSKGIKARFAWAEATNTLVQMLEEGLVDYILDGQTFDLEGVRSIINNPRHVMTSPFSSYNYHSKEMLPACWILVILGATK
jgi:citrate lyase subunit alpha/citrate CoA-transferase